EPWNYVPLFYVWYHTNNPSGQSSIQCFPQGASLEWHLKKTYNVTGIGAFHSNLQGQYSRPTRATMTPNWFTINNDSSNVIIVDSLLWKRDSNTRCTYTGTLGFAINPGTGWTNTASGDPTHWSCTASGWPMEADSAPYMWFQVHRQ